MSQKVVMNPFSILSTFCKIYFYFVLVFQGDEDLSSGSDGLLDDEDDDGDSEDDVIVKKNKYKQEVEAMTKPA